MNSYNEAKQQKAFILGAGPFAQEVYYYLTTNGFSPALVTDEAIENFDCVCNADYRLFADRAVTYLGSGKCEVKMRMARELSGVEGPSIDLSAYNAAQHNTGLGTILAPGSVISPYVRIGKHVLVNYLASIGHHTRIYDFAVVSPNASVGGHCLIEEGAYVGAGANIRENLTIGAGAIIGMGAVVTKDVEPGDVVVGCPAKSVERKGGW